MRSSSLSGLMEIALLIMLSCPITGFTQRSRANSRETQIQPSINIRTDFFGPFNKTRLEILFKNVSQWDSLEGFLRFQTNRSAIVKEMWLEIDGDLKQAETLTRHTGMRIYDRITRRKIDPAILIRNSAGNFTLRVFPVKRNQVRRVLIDYVTVLQADSPGLADFFFGTRSSATKKLAFKATEPMGTKINMLNKNFKLACTRVAEHFEMTEQKLDFEPKEDIRIQFAYGIIKVPFQYQKNELVFLHRENNCLPVRPPSDTPAYLAEIARLAREQKPYCLQVLTGAATISPNDLFTQKFLQYLRRAYDIEVMNILQNDMSWFEMDNRFMYLDGDISVRETNPFEIKNGQVARLICTDG